EVEAPAPQLARECLHVALDPENRRPALARDRERFGRDVDGGDGGAKLRELCGGLTRPRLQVEDSLAAQVRERPANVRWQAEAAGHRVRAAAVDLVPCTAIQVRRFHQASSEK